MTTLFGQHIEPDFDIGKEERNARGKKAFWVGFLLLLAYGLFRTVTVEVIQAYMATGAFYGLLFYVKWGDHLKNWWLWKAIAVSVPMHVAYLGLLFWSDAAFPQSMTKTLLFTPVLIVGCAVEFALMDAVIGRFKPRADGQPVAPLPQK